MKYENNNTTHKLAGRDIVAYFAEYGGCYVVAEADGDNAILNGSLFLGADTPIGPLYTGFGFAEGGRYTAFLYLGPAF